MRKNVIKLIEVFLLKKRGPADGLNLGISPFLRTFSSKTSRDRKRVSKKFLKIMKTY